MLVEAQRILGRAADELEAAQPLAYPEMNGNTWLIVKQCREMQAALSTLPTPQTSSAVKVEERNVLEGVKPIPQHWITEDEARDIIDVTLLTFNAADNAHLRPQDKASLVLRWMRNIGLLYANKQPPSAPPTPSPQPDVSGKVGELSEDDFINVVGQAIYAFEEEANCGDGLANAYNKALYVYRALRSLETEVGNTTAETGNRND